MEPNKDQSERNQYYLFEEVSSLFKGLSITNFNQFEDTRNCDHSFKEIPINMGPLIIQETKQCPLCQITFSTREEHTQHYKSSWHLFNLRQKLLGYKAVSEEIFKQFEDDIQSGSSSSDEESSQERRRPLTTALKTKEECSKPTKTRHHAKIFLKNEKGQILSLYRTIVYGKQNVPQTTKELLYSITCLPSQLNWAIILLGGGHFAASVFNGKEIICHKTLRRYTVRAKQGGAQRLKDNRTGMAHSAGAALRRKNQMELDKDIQMLLQSWADKLALCDRIFYQSPGLNQSTLFAGKSPPFNKTDPRLRSIPFTTKKPTFNETQRVHKILATIEVHESLPEGLSTQTNDDGEELMQYSSSSSDEDITKGPCDEIQLVSELNEPKKFEPDAELGRISEDQAKKNIENQDSHLSLKDEPQATNADDASTPTAFKGSKKDFSREKKKKKPRPQADQKIEKGGTIMSSHFKKGLEEACQTDDVDKIKELLSDLNNTTDDSRENLIRLLNHKFSEDGSTILHSAAFKGSKAIIYFLLEEGADPAVKNEKSQPPYVVSKDKDTRSVFRRFMGSHPQKYDYAKAQIPSPLTEEMDRMRNQKNLERKKEKKKKQKLKKSEEEQVKTFLSLTDEEKVKVNADHISKFEKKLVRCLTCGEKMNERIPFEYLDFKFCSVNCLRVHRFSSQH